LEQYVIRADSSDIFPPKRKKTAPERLGRCAASHIPLIEILPIVLLQRKLYRVKIYMTVTYKSQCLQNVSIASHSRREGEGSKINLPFEALVPSDPFRLELLGLSCVSGQGAVAVP